MKKLLAIILTAATLLSLCACGGEKEEKPDETEPNIIVDDVDNTDETEKPSKEEAKKKAEKINSINRDSSLSVINNAFIYSDSESGLEGIISYDGKSDTGAIYYDIDDFGNYLTARAKEYGTPEDLDSINSTYLVDCFGNKVISESYCMFDKLSDKYVLAAKVVGQTTDKDECDIRLTNKLSITIIEGDILYKAEYHIYDATTGKRVECYTGYDDNVEVYGEVIKYRDGQEWITMNTKGEMIPENVWRISDLEGNYIIEDDGKGTLYNAFGEKLFDYNTETGYEPYWFNGGFFICINNSTNKIALLDESGKIVSAEIPCSGRATAEIKGDFIVIDDEGDLDKIYDFKGNLISEIDGVFYYNKINPEYYIVTNSEDDMVIFDEEGKILLSVESDSSIDVSGCLAYKEINDEEYYFSVKDKDFTIKGRDLYDTYMVTVENEDGTVDIVDTVTGKTIVEGYEDYDVAIIGIDIYIIGQKDSDGGYAYDIYKY